MKKSDKKVLIDQLTEQFNSHQFFYFADDSSINVEGISKLRRMCFEKGVKYKVAKNSLIQKALEASNKNAEGIYPTLKGASAVMFSDGANTPAKIIKEFRGDGTRPVFKSAFVDEEIYTGDNNLMTLVNLKSRDELIGDVILLLQSPIQRVMGALKNHTENGAPTETPTPPSEEPTPTVEPTPDAPTEEATDIAA
jgi:large subunit ribosomal protein L10